MEVLARMAVTHAQGLGRPLVSASKDELNETNVAGLFDPSYLQARITPGKNLLFSAAFPLLWEEVSRASGSTILMQYDPPICVGLQGEKDYRNDVDPSVFMAAGDYGRADVISTVRGRLEAHFAGAA